MSTLVADGEVWGSYDTIPGLALCPVPMVALGLPARRTAALAQLHQQDSCRTAWIPCMGPRDPLQMSVPVAPSMAVGLALTLRGVRVCLPPGFEHKLLLTITTNREIELGLRVREHTCGK